MTVRRILLRRSTSLEWQTANPALRQGEVGIEVSENGSASRMKIGDGFTSWNDLAYTDDYTLDTIREEYGDEATFEVNFQLHKS
jgi:hypothetical protein